MRNVSQRRRNMLAKAGESDRAIRVKMVCCLLFPTRTPLPHER